MENPEEENKDTLSLEHLNLIRAIAEQSCALDSDITQINLMLEHYLSLPINDLRFSSINSKMTDIMERIDQEINQTKHAISIIQNDPSCQSITANSALMVSKKHRKMFEDYVNRDLEVVSMPYPPLCGAIPPIPNYILPVGSFVAAKVESEYILCYVQGVLENQYIIADATLADPSINFKINQDEVIPMPTTLPDIKTKGTEYPSGAKVLSLWPEENVWTSVFYQASVVKSPSETGTFYKLIFDGDSDKSTFVPEKFVIPQP
ncbi:hypothetical protein M9Y10_032734 [Tritrichomonas musculus]|uniref:SGF29 C-terminal domain-containing protein n=1 Tax=Tritrichomonas musculus TaxID=1915356 RepID=A0ABR2GXP4_9EUKA